MLKWLQQFFELLTPPHPVAYLVIPRPTSSSRGLPRHPRGLPRHPRGLPRHPAAYLVIPRPTSSSRGLPRHPRGLPRHIPRPTSSSRGLTSSSRGLTSSSRGLTAGSITRPGNPPLNCFIFVRNVTSILLLWCDLRQLLDFLSNIYYHPLTFFSIYYLRGDRYEP